MIELGTRWVTACRPNSIGYDELALNVPQPTPFAPVGPDESEVMTSSGRCLIEGAFVIIGYGNCIDGQILMLATTDGNTYELVAVNLQNGSAVAEVREPAARHNIDASFSTFARLRPDGVYVFRLRTDVPAEGFVLLRYGFDT